MPAFWEYPPLPHDTPYYQFISDPFHSKSKLFCNYKSMNLRKPTFFVKGYINYYTIKFESSSIKNGLRIMKMSKSLIRSLCAYLMSRANYVISNTPSP